MGDSAAFNPPAPDGFMWQYEAELERHFGVEVELRNRTRGAIHSTVMLEQLRTQESLRADLADADVVTLDIPINVWVVPIQTINGVDGRDPADCGGADGEQCLRDALAVYEADTDAIIDEIVSICDEDTLIRLYDIWMIKTGHQIELGTLDVNNPYWKAGMDHVAESAARYGIPVARVYDAFMGPEGTDDPFDAGLLDTDEMHPNAAGAGLMTDLVVELGY